MQREQIGERVKRIRESKEWTKKRLCMLAGISFPTLKTLEGGGVVTTEVIKKIEKVFDVFLTDVEL